MRLGRTKHRQVIVVDKTMGDIQRRDDDKAYVKETAEKDEKEHTGVGLPEIKSGSFSRVASDMAPPEATSRNEYAILKVKVNVDYSREASVGVGDFASRLSAPYYEEGMPNMGESSVITGARRSV